METNKTAKYVLVALLAFVATVAALDTLVTYIYPQKGTIATASLEMYLDGELYPNSTAVDWGICEAGSVYTIPNMTVANTGDVNLTVSIVSNGLPSGWKIDWQNNNTMIAAGTHNEGWLNLTIPAVETVWPTWSFSLNGNA
ncbi:hypothetical protein MUO79_10225 [Candidatus Bathyarchaeota archaeon]|nr:hypothetical protein [Candidatus Bathyarchaeota archaeon]